MQPPRLLLARATYGLSSSHIAASTTARRGAVNKVLRVHYATAADDAPIPPPSEGKEEPAPLKKKTKKLISELPVTRLLPDGTLAKPLAEWNGGLSSSRRASPRSVEERTDAAKAEEGAVLVGKQRKSKSLKADVETEDEPSKRPGQVLHTVSNTKQKGGKKKKLADDFAKTIKQARTQLAMEIKANHLKYPNCILLTRVGQFYESYFDQAEEVARLLNIKLARKSWGGEYVPMAGFPIVHLERSLKTLVQTERRFVALCEEFPRPLAEGLGFERRVARVVTPGTLLDEGFLNPYENNYLLAVSPGAKDEVGLSWIDVSTGEFFAKTTDIVGLHDELVRLGPREVVLEKALEQQPDHPIRVTLQQAGPFVSYTEVLETATDDAAPASSSLSTVTTPTEILSSKAESQGIDLLTSYLRLNLLDHMPKLSEPSREGAGHLRIDAHTLTALEIRESIRDGGVSGSLLSTIKRTTTTGGTRLLARWLSSPSTSLSEINQRQSLVALFKARPHLCDDISNQLSDSSDVTRVVQRFLSGRGDPSDFLILHKTINKWAELANLIAQERHTELDEQGKLDEEEWKSLDKLVSRLTDLKDLGSRIGTALRAVEVDLISVRDEDEVDLGEEETPEAVDPEATEANAEENLFTSQKWFIKPEFSPELTQLHAILQELHTKRLDLETELQEKYDVSSLTLRFSKSLGMHVHIGRSKRDAPKLMKGPGADVFVPLTTNNTTSSFFYKDWTVLGSKIIEVVTAITANERAAFENLRAEVNTSSSIIKANANVIDELDVAIGFANLANEMGFVRPILKDDTTYNVVNGRHPTVELGLLKSGRVFTPNTVAMEKDSRLLIITGPNMAGKSTVLRQTALIAILAQVGSFVPADSAEIGIIDGLFSRVGAKDDLSRDRSTFMVEMLETAEILRRATPRSLVIMDEVGRGTTVQDGIAIAFSTLHHLYSVNNCRALFATHFHDLADMLGCSDDNRGFGNYKDVRFFCTDVAETEDGLFTYSHRLKPGVNRDSHGIKVARLAGMPEPAIQMAAGVLAALKQRNVGIGRQALQDLGQTSGQFVKEIPQQANEPDLLI